MAPIEKLLANMSHCQIKSKPYDLQKTCKLELIALETSAPALSLTDTVGDINVDGLCSEKNGSYISAFFHRQIESNKKNGIVKPDSIPCH